MNDLHEAAAPEGDRKWKAVYTIIERGNPMSPGRERKAVWLRVGIAFVNRDQSINVKLDAMPTNGTLHIRDYVPPDEAARARRGDDERPGFSRGIS